MSKPTQATDTTADIKVTFTTSPSLPAVSLNPSLLQIILLGDSAVGKSKLMERFLLDNYVPHQLSTYALTVFRHKTKYPFNPSPSTPQRDLSIEFWDTAGQERFLSMHPSYYIGSHACVLVFDVGRKVTYKNLDIWYDELVRYRGSQLPLIIVANKIDMDPSRARKSFGFIDRRRAERSSSSPSPIPSNSDPLTDQSQDPYLPLYFASASDGTNVVSIFQDAIDRAVKFKEQLAKGEAGSFVDEVLDFIEEEGRRKDGLFSDRDVEKKSVPA
ncbi:Rab-like protein 2A [Rhizophlyctis rosea]|nr:Rab-like protein 2A [Rhizophlyctis rosea]